MDAQISFPVNPDENPCISCGACCAFFRASFYWAETDAAEGGTVPADLTEKLNDFRSVMRGSSPPKPRCIALIGEIGKSVRCSIYELRASVCRDFSVSWENGIHNERCDRARLAWELPVLARPAAFPAIPAHDPDSTEPPCRPPLPNAA